MGTDLYGLDSADLRCRGKHTRSFDADLPKMFWSISSPRTSPTKRSSSHDQFRSKSASEPYEVLTAVNRAGNNDPSLLEPIAGRA